MECFKWQCFGVNLKQAEVQNVGFLPCPDSCISPYLLVDKLEGRSVVLYLFAPLDNR
jgi:hypothetical protein